jgi:hypothetical protein
MPKLEHQDSTVLTDDELRTLDAHGRAANHLAAGQICLRLRRGRSRGSPRPSGALPSHRRRGRRTGECPGTDV